MSQGKSPNVWLEALAILSTFLMFQASFFAAVLICTILPIVAYFILY